MAETGGRGRPAHERSKPKWNHRTGELSLAGRVILKLRHRNTYQWQLLTAFNRSRWAARIDDPLPPTLRNGPERLRQTVHDLNRRQKPVRLRFTVEVDGEGVRWNAVQ